MSASSSNNDLPVITAEPEDFGDLGSISEDQIAGSVTYVYAIDEDGRKVPNGMSREKYLAKIQGKRVDFDDIRERWGGGNYAIYVRQARGGAMIRSVTVRIDGPARMDPVATPAAVAVPSETVRLAEAVALALSPSLEAMSRAIATLAQHAAAPPAPAQPDALAITERVLTLVKTMQPPPPPPPPASDPTQVMKLFMSGWRMGSEAAGGGKSVGDAIAEIAPKALETIGSMTTAFTSRPPRPAPARAQAPRPASPTPTTDAAAQVQLEPAAEVVTTEPTTTMPSDDVMARGRWLVGYTEGMYVSGADPVKTADVVEDLLSDFELERLGEYDAEGALGFMTAFGPVPDGLSSADGRIWLQKFLDRLREEGDDDDGNDDVKGPEVTSS